MKDTKGKIAWIYKHELEKIAPELGLEYTTPHRWYDAIEEYFHEQGFVLPDGDIKHIKSFSHGQLTYHKYNVIIMVEHDKLINKIGMVYLGINSKMDDLSKLSFALNHLRAEKDINGNPNEDSVKSLNYLKEYIDKMRELGVKNIKELLK